MLQAVPSKEIQNEETPLMSASDIEQINTTISKFPENTQFAVAKIENGEICFYGVEKTNDSLNVINNDKSVFEIASISKVFTSTMLAQLSLDGKLALDDDIAKYLDVEINNNAQINFMQLANHSSGLPRLPPGLLWPSLFTNQENPYGQYGENKLIGYVENKLKQKKIGKYRYSNLAVGLLGHILGRVLNTNYEAALQQLVCQPLELNSTTTDRSSISQTLVQGRNKKGKEFPFWDFNVLAGAGGIYSNVSDLAKFILANFDENNHALQLQQKSTLEVNKGLKVGLGWHLVNSKQTNNADWLFHNGATYGSSSELLADPANKKSVILLTNVSGKFLIKAGKLQKLILELMKST